MTRFFALAVLAIAVMGVTAPSFAAVHVYNAILDGPSGSPPVASPGIGSAQVTYDDLAHTMHVHVTFSGLLAGVTAAHIHSATAIPGAGNAGVATTTPTFAGFPSAVTSGTYDNTLDMLLASSWNPAFVTANGGSPATADLALAASLAAGTAYLNIHTSVFPGGEIRGFLVTPEPATLVLLAAGALAVLRRRRTVQ